MEIYYCIFEFIYIFNIEYILYKYTSICSFINKYISMNLYYFTVKSFF